MALKISDSMQATAYHVNDGPVDMYSVDARLACAQHPDEWSMKPWEPGAAEEARKRLHARRVAAAQAAGQEPPPAPTEPAMTDEDRAEFEEWKSVRAKAHEKVEAAKKEQAERDAKAAELAEAEAILASPPPRPDPNRRRPLTGAAKANADRTAAKKAADEQAERDRQGAANKPFSPATAPAPTGPVTPKDQAST